LKNILAQPLVLYSQNLKNFSLSRYALYNGLFNFSSSESLVSPFSDKFSFRERRIYFLPIIASLSLPVAFFYKAGK
jgi:hypothetical protein